MITIPSLSDVTDILDTDLVMVTNSQGQSYKIAGSELNKRNKIIIASSTTVTGALLKTGNCVRIYFTANINGVNASTTMQINYNGTNYYVKVPKNGALANYVAFDLGSSTYRYVQAYTTLELLYDGTQFVILGNPVVISSTDYTIYADGLKRVDYVTANDKGMVTSNAVSNRFNNTFYKNHINITVQDYSGQTRYYKIYQRTAPAAYWSTPVSIKGTYGRIVNTDKEIFDIIVDFRSASATNNGNITGYVTQRRGSCDLILTWDNTTSTARIYLVLKENYAYMDVYSDASISLDGYTASMEGVQGNTLSNCIELKSLV